MGNVTFPFQGGRKDGDNSYAKLILTVSFDFREKHS